MPASNHRTPSHHKEPRKEDASAAPAVTPKKPIDTKTNCPPIEEP